MNTSEMSSRLDLSRASTQSVTPQKVTTSFCDRLCKAMPRAKVHKFQMVLKTHRIAHHDRMSSTRAFTIKVPTSSVSQLLPSIKDVTNKTKEEYVAFRMCQRNLDAFQGAIRYLNHILANQHVIMIHNLETEAMYYLTD